MIKERSLEESGKEVASKRYTVRTEVRERCRRKRRGMKCKREDTGIEGMVVIDVCG